MDLNRLVSNVPYSFNQIKNLIDKISDLKILIIGDTIIDEYKYVSYLGKVVPKVRNPTLFHPSF